MEWMKTTSQKIGSSLQDAWYNFEDAVYRNPKKAILYAIGGLVTVSLLTIAMIAANARIRQTQISTLVVDHLPVDKIIPITYGKEDKTIEDKQAISVMFTRPQGKAYHEIMAQLEEKSQELNRKFYYYPIVYDATEIGNTYKLNPDEVTFVFFEKGVEKNRFVFDSLEDADINFIPELNRLPMWNIGGSDSEEE
ncbi:hypothetical protein [Candidatus Enterococcus willemsii]|nr:hypothetical protein [Enterococcus sp. CU12B]